MIVDIFVLELQYVWIDHVVMQVKTAFGRKGYGAG